MSIDRPDARVARQAARQLSLVTLGDAVSAGLSPTAVRRRLRTGRWERKRRTVYAIAGVRPTFEQEVEAARRAHGADALVTARPRLGSGTWSGAMPATASTSSR